MLLHKNVQNKNSENPFMDKLERERKKEKAYGEFNSVLKIEFGAESESWVRWIHAVDSFVNGTTRRKVSGFYYRIEENWISTEKKKNHRQNENENEREKKKNESTEGNKKIFQSLESYLKYLSAPFFLKGCYLLVSFSHKYSHITESNPYILYTKMRALSM